MVTESPNLSNDFKLANFRDVDSSSNPSVFVSFLDRFHVDFNEMIMVGVDLLRLKLGSSVLDVGCGPGTIIPALVARVGSTGNVTGIDLSQELVAEAHSRLGALELPVTIRVGNAQALDFPDANFDAARADRVLAFVPNPPIAVRELARITKPGGRVVVTEVDLGASMVDSSDVDTTRAVLAGVSDEFPNGWIGRRLRGHFLDSGFTDVEVHFFTLLNTSMIEWNRRFAVEASLASAVKTRRVSELQAVLWLEELRERDAAGRFFSASTMCMVAATKPTIRTPDIGQCRLTPVNR